MLREVAMTVVSAIVASVGASLVMTARNDEKIAAMTDKINQIDRMITDQVIKNSETICQNRERIARMEGCK